MDAGAGGGRGVTVDVERVVGRMVLLTAEASPQFGGRRGFFFEVSRILPWTTMDEWVWLEGYQLPPAGRRGGQMRQVFVRREALSPSWPRRGE